MQMQEHSYRGEHVVEFLRMRLRKIPGKLLVIWDGSPIHRGQVVKGFLSHGAAKRLHLERLPGSAPELNPTSGGVECAQTPRVEKSVLSEPLSCASRDRASQRAPPPPEGDAPVLFLSCARRCTRSVNTFHPSLVVMKSRTFFSLCPPFGNLGVPIHPLLARLLNEAIRSLQATPAIEEVLPRFQVIGEG